MGVGSNKIKDNLRVTKVTDRIVRRRKNQELTDFKKIKQSMNPGAAAGTAVIPASGPACDRQFTLYTGVVLFWSTCTALLSKVISFTDKRTEARKDQVTCKDTQKRSKTRTTKSG